MFIVSFARAQKHFHTFDEAQWPSLNLDLQYLPKDSRNSGTYEANFHFWAGHVLQIQDCHGSFGTVGTYVAPFQ